MLFHKIIDIQITARVLESINSVGDRNLATNKKNKKIIAGKKYV